VGSSSHFWHSKSVGRRQGADIIKQSTAIQQSVCRVLTPYNLHRAMPISLALVSLLALSHLEIPDKGTKIATGRNGKEAAAAAMVTNQALRLYKQREKLTGRSRLLVYLRTELLHRLSDKCGWHTLRHRADCRLTSTVSRNVRLNVQSPIRLSRRWRLSCDKKPSRKPANIQEY